MGKRGPKKGHGGRPRLGKRARVMLQVRLPPDMVRALEDAVRPRETLTSVVEGALRDWLVSEGVWESQE